MARVTVTIGGDAVEVHAGSLSINRELRGRSTCEFTSRFTDFATVPPGVGETVIVEKDGRTLFGGQVHTVSRRTIAAEFALEYRYTCTDWWHILDNRLTGERQWTDTAAGVIFTALIASLSDEGFTVDAEAGPVIKRLETNWASATQLIERLLELTPGFDVVITPTRECRYFDTSAHAAPFAVTSSPNTNNVHTLEITPTREQMANRVVVRLASYVMDPRLEFFSETGRTGGVPDPEPSQMIDGARKSFEVTYPMHSTPSVWVNWAPQTVGVGDLDTGKDWYWHQGSRTLVQADDADALSPPDELQVEYVGLTEGFVVAQNTVAITERASIEDRSGIYEVVVDASDPLTATQAQQLADAVVEYRSRLSFEARGETTEVIEPHCLGLEPGHLLTINRSGYAADGEYLVRSVRFADIRGRDEMRVSFVAVKGPITEDAVDFFRRQKAVSTSAVSGAAVQTGLVTISYE